MATEVVIVAEDNEPVQSDSEETGEDLGEAVEEAEEAAEDAEDSAERSEDSAEVSEDSAEQSVAAAQVSAEAASMSVDSLTQIRMMLDELPAKIAEAVRPVPQPETVAEIPGEIEDTSPVEIPEDDAPDDEHFWYRRWGKR